ncbi:hypothetical protein T11_18326 [Trichinella zimbabwensis]|uniref:Uncharacterized protein n=1 Tax=Trichinella zimbabwensis TaxID=268475 RepID=A0A0V1GWJ4_9BILA|nr:hypothetical protein T11_14473 [Trichinella zimbabwensis]KRZ02759.1 hypothetical protein T11_17724 [Trichinella zimbabwensis]KRZ02776.1 hypothetical protein T11_18326 [Trichinella zimbabwensis]
MPDKKGCDGAISTNLDVSTVIKQTLYMETCLWITTWHMSCKKFTERRRSEGTKSIGENYDEEITAPSADPSSSVQFLVFRQVSNAMYSMYIG